ncbi:hypothetical protein [Streptomyces goshikiensis]|uniref:hypothetical protein n=1 Tax=Streptomyces goshikiensis TaxID=1942 RepID=UPI0037194D85
MLPEFRSHASALLSHQLEQRLGLNPRLEAGRIDVERVADIAVVASAHSDGYAATAHLLGLLATLPAPTEVGERFWSDLWRSSGSLYLLPANIKTFVLSSPAGEGAGLAGQILSAVDERTPPQRVAAGEAPATQATRRAIKAIVREPAPMDGALLDALLLAVVAAQHWHHTRHHDQQAEAALARRSLAGTVCRRSRVLHPRPLGLGM